METVGFLLLKRDLIAGGLHRHGQAISETNLIIPLADIDPEIDRSLRIIPMATAHHTPQYRPDQADLRNYGDGMDRRDPALLSPSSDAPDE
ncbi:hypothetical protein VB716_11505 [Synechococcus sp. CCY9201]|uniref:hypothetical protein n=1 Tax=Synechococcus sp. CCY9201 TaxID=174697 RepID=UPI002B21C95B|nr:hypothetical protein [Synechococcus sp. CCY9201]MEA5474847.1 hypothetical protein [Synechococcus sp. CCY9201]